METIPKIRVRFAPSPTGWLHVGGARTALFNYLFARHNNGKFLLRIEDTDRERSKIEMTEAILRDLAWLGLEFDEEVVYQAAGKEKQVALCEQLVSENKAYRCFCSPETLLKKRETNSSNQKFLYDGTCRCLSEAEVETKLTRNIPYTIRFKTPVGNTEWTDLVRGVVSFDNAEVDDFIILRSDGSPVYQIAVVSDDHDMEITHVIRGDDHLSNTPKQILLFKALGWDAPQFAHISMILGPDKKRLSKRHGAASVGEYEESGYLPAAMNNFLALLGWSPGEDREIMTLSSLIELFSLDRISGNPAVFDEDKLNWMNSKYIQEMSDEDLLAAVSSRIISSGLATEALLEREHAVFLQIAGLLKPRIKCLNDFSSQAAFFLTPPAAYEETAVKKHWLKEGVKKRLQSSRMALNLLQSWTEENIEKVIRGTAVKEEVGAGKIIHPVRLALTGSGSSPGLFEIMAILGKETVISRLDTALIYLENLAD